MAEITLKGNPCNTCGELPAVGSKAPDFTLVDSTLTDRTLADFAGKRKVLSIVPSLDTPVCQTSTRQFNEKAGSLDNTVVLVVSADLPFAQKRFCESENLQGVQALSTMRGSFSDSYGVRITNGPLAGVTARAVLVLDESDQVVHSQLVGEIAEEPDYSAALAALS